eukprot:Em0035g20a
MSESNLERHFGTERHRILVESLSHVSKEQNQHRCSEEGFIEDVGAGFDRNDEDCQYTYEDGCSDEDESVIESDVVQLARSLERSSTCKPFPNLLFALLYILIHGPHPMGESSLSFIWFMLQSAGHSVPSLSKVRKFLLPGFVPSLKFLSPDRYPFYYNSMRSTLSSCLGKRKIARDLTRYPVVTSIYKEVFHGKRWNTDPRFFTPMITTNDIPVFLRECVAFSHPQFGMTTAFIVKFFQKGDDVELYFEGDLLLDARQFKIAVPDSTIYFLPVNTRILFGRTEQCISLITSVEQKPTDIVQWEAATDSFKRFSSEETAQYLSPHPFKAKAAGRRVVTVPLVLFSDDTSGNKSKKWHKFESWSFMLAGLPRNLNAKHENIHFICCSDQMDALGMSGPIADELTGLEMDGIEVYDAYLNEQVLVIAPLLCIICDNPQASKLVNHLGGSANKYCRFCMADRDTSPCLVCEERSLQQSLQQMEIIRSQRTEALREQHRTLYGVREVSNPLLHVPSDLYRCLPVEALHIIPLGICKAFLKDVMPKLSPTQKREVLARIRAFNHSGFKVKIHGNMCYHYQSFVGRDYKAWMQMAIFILSPYLSNGQLIVLVNLSKVFQIAYCSFFELSKAEAWHQICVDFVHSVRDFMPKMLRKQKVHYILHLVQCMQDYGPSSSFCAERPESFNSNIRMQNIFGNKQAPSRDIAVHFAVIEHLRFVCEGGYYNDKESCDTGLHDLYYSNQVQRFLNSAPSKELNAHKAIYTAATARMPSGACDQFMFLKATITELGVESTLEQILKMDPPYDVIVHLGSLMDGKLQQFKAVMSHTVELVHAGNYIELDPPFFQIWTAPDYH